MTERGRLWIDATDLVDWRRRKTGTQRVVRDIIVAYQKLRDIRLFYYSQVLSRFFEVDLAKLLAEDLRGQQSDKVLPVSRPTSLRSLFHCDVRRAVFQRHDQLLVLGGDWRRRGFLSGLRDLRRAVGVTVHHFVHDVMPITTPHLFPAEESAACAAYLCAAFDIVDSVITSSHWNVGQILSLIEAGTFASRPLCRVGLGTTSLHDVTPQRPKVRLPDKFVLSVGTFELKKNRRAIYQAYKLSRDPSALGPVVIAGQPGGVPDEGVRLLCRDPELSGLVHVVTNVNDAELCWLYSNCAYTIYGSLAEGWGIPIDESLSFGAPCLCSGTSGMPEVGGAAAQYYDPHDPVSLHRLMRRMADPDYLEQRRRSIRAEYRPPSWETICRTIDQSMNHQ